MKSDKKEKFRYLSLGITIFLVIAASLCLFFVFFRSESIGGKIGSVLHSISPVIYGAVIAYLLAPICNFLDRKMTAFFSRKKPLSEKGKKTISGINVFLSLLFALVLLCGIVALVLPQLINSILSIYNSIPKSEASINKLFDSLYENHPQLANTIQSISNSVIGYIQDWLKTELLPGLRTTLGSITSGLWEAVVFLMNLFIGFIVAAYFLGSRKVFSSQAKKLLYGCFKTKHVNFFLHETAFANRAFSGFISGKLIDSLIVGLICYAGTLILDTPYGMLVSVIIGITNVIPFFGPYIGAIPSVMIILFKNPSNPWPCLYFVIFLAILMQVDGNIISPKIIGDKTGLSGFWVLFAILLFGGTFGFVGMLIGVPVFAVIYHEIRRILHHFLKKKNLQTETGFYAELLFIDEEGRPVYKAEKQERPHKNIFKKKENEKKEPDSNADSNSNTDSVSESDSGSDS